MCISTFSDQYLLTLDFLKGICKGIFERKSLQTAFFFSKQFLNKSELGLSRWDGKKNKPTYSDWSKDRFDNKKSFSKAFVFSLPFKKSTEGQKILTKFLP